MSEHLKPLAHGLGPLFANLERRAQATVDLAARVREALPSPEKQHVVAANFRGETLVILADSAAWSSRIRYAQQDLLAHLNAQGEMRFTKVRVKVGKGSDQVIG